MPWPSGRSGVEKSDSWLERVGAAARPRLNRSAPGDASYRSPRSRFRVAGFGFPERQGPRRHIAESSSAGAVELGGYEGGASRSRISLARFRDDGEVGRDSGMTGMVARFRALDLMQLWPK